MMLWKLIDRASSLAAAGIVFALMGHSSPAVASLVINAQYTPALQSNQAAVDTLNHLVASYEGFFSDNVTVSILFDGTLDPNAGLARSSTQYWYEPYANFRNHLGNAATNPRDHLAFNSSVPDQSHNPVPNVPPTTEIFLARANARVLGFPVASTGWDSIITFNLTEHNFSRTGQINSSKYDLLDSAAHELNEALGLGSGLNNPANLPVPRPQDLFRYSGPGMRSYTKDPVVSYLSYDNGVTPLVHFNQEDCSPVDQGGTDCGDWYSGTGHTPRQQDSNATRGVQLGWDYVALGNLDVIGWTLVPEPSTGLLLATGLLGLAIRRRTH